MKILITGGNGQLGKDLYAYLSSNHIDLLSFDKSQLDISDYNSVYNVINQEKPNVVINCGAYTKVDNCEQNLKKAFSVNALGPRNLAIATAKTNSAIVQISTDYVFSGDANTPYREYDETSPQTIYGKSKLMGEENIIKHNPRHFIIRTAWLYGNGHNFLNTMLKLADYKNELSVVDDQFGTPTSTVELSKIISTLISTELYGTYHGTCNGSCSWYDFAHKIFDITGTDVILNRISSSDLKTLAVRPKYSVLDNFMLDILNVNTFKSWDIALEEYIMNHHIKM